MLSRMHSRAVMVGLAGLFAVTIALVACGACAAYVATDQAVTYQINPAHSGSVQAPDLIPPLLQRWSVDFDSWISYPLIAEGKVFVTKRNVTAYGTQLYAIDATTGKTFWGPKALGGTMYWSGAAYENGRVFAVNFDGMLRAFNAGTGAEMWNKQLPGQNAFSAPPTPYDGILYVSGGATGGTHGTIYAIDEANGTVLWSSSVENGDMCSPAVDDSGVYAGYTCGQSYRFDRLTGQLIWHHSTECDGGGGKNVALYNGSLYGRDYDTWDDGFGYILNSVNGQLVGRYDAWTIPAFSGDFGYFNEYGKLKCKNLSTGATAWSFPVNGMLSSAPIVANGAVYIGSLSGTVYAVNATTGAQLWTANAGSTIAGPDEQNVSQPLTGLAVGQNLLVVPAGKKLVAYETFTHRPLLVGPKAVTAEATSAAGAQAKLQAQVSDSNGDAITVIWYVDGAKVQTDNVRRSTPGSTTTLTLTQSYSMGTHTIKITAQDATFSPANSTSIVTVKDTTAPLVSASIRYWLVWPPNNQLVPMQLYVSARDAVDKNLKLQYRVYSDEVSPRRSKTYPEAVFSTDLFLRAERKTLGDGRVYLVVVSTTDSAGNKGFTCFTFGIPVIPTGQSLYSVASQCNAAETYCRANNGAPPPTYYPIAESPLGWKR